jgi:hypothetical protein
MIQKPGVINGITVLLKSIEGCGKGFICEVINKITGDEYIYHPEMLKQMFLIVLVLL